MFKNKINNPVSLKLAKLRYENLKRDLNRKKQTDLKVIYNKFFLNLLRKKGLTNRKKIYSFIRKYDNIRKRLLNIYKVSQIEQIKIVHDIRILKKKLALNNIFPARYVIPKFFFEKKLAIASTQNFSLLNKEKFNFRKMLIFRQTLLKNYSFLQMIYNLKKKKNYIKKKKKKKKN